MSTRGAIGIRVSGVDKVSYNHFDSYPDGLGEQFVEQVKALRERPNLKEQAIALRLVNEDTPPTDDDIVRLSQSADTSVSTQKLTEWHVLLREMQGDLTAMLDAGVMIDGADFLSDSLFCEYAYILNLDDGVLEFYQGFNKDRDATGRYASSGKPSKDYCGVRLVGTCPISDIPDDWHEKFFPKEED